MSRAEMNLELMDMIDKRLENYSGRAVLYAIRQGYRDYLRAKRSDKLRTFLEDPEAGLILLKRKSWLQIIWQCLNPRRLWKRCRTYGHRLREIRYICLALARWAENARSFFAPFKGLDALTVEATKHLAACVIKEISTDAFLTSSGCLSEDIECESDDDGYDLVIRNAVEDYIQGKCDPYKSMVYSRREAYDAGLVNAFVQDIARIVDCSEGAETSQDQLLDCCKAFLFVNIAQVDGTTRYRHQKSQRYSAIADYLNTHRKKVQMKMDLAERNAMPDGIST